MARFTDAQLARMYAHVTDEKLAAYIAWNELNVPRVKSGPNKGVPHLSWSLRMDELNGERLRRKYGTQSPTAADYERDFQS